MLFLSIETFSIVVMFEELITPEFKTLEKELVFKYDMHSEIIPKLYSIFRLFFL